MSTTIRPGEAALPGKKQYEKGFTLPELLVSLCILMILLQGVWQWGVLFQRTTERIQQNQQAVLIAQCYFANFPLDLPAGWSVTVQREETGTKLEQQFVVVSYQEQQWPFYYIGERR